MSLAAWGQLGLRGLQLGGDGGLVELLDIPGALGEHDQALGVHLGEATLHEHTNGAGIAQPCIHHARAQGGEDGRVAGAAR